MGVWGLAEQSNKRNTNLSTDFYRLTSTNCHFNAYKNAGLGQNMRRNVTRRPRKHSMFKPCSRNRNPPGTTNETILEDPNKQGFFCSNSRNGEEIYVGEDKKKKHWIWEKRELQWREHPLAERCSLLPGFLWLWGTEPSPPIPWAARTSSAVQSAGPGPTSPSSTSPTHPPSLQTNSADLPCTQLLATVLLLLLRGRQIPPFLSLFFSFPLLFWIPVNTPKKIKT